ncbi:hypothetical protein B0T21DRAFT_139129 [Apiosordaria backusii]|uniref:ASX DEUBAD domain-containing protein n=1 Tax=Apiosordaria backusii TaxID=314023 RepID=A0AA40EHM9_9PEZI|nr:hypothetical protein B0T21DRAFT_139129 [Apiosordaria backusii]
MEEIPVAMAGVLSPSPTPTSDTTPTPSPPSSDSKSITGDDTSVKEALKGSDVEDPYSKDEEFDDDAKSYDDDTDTLKAYKIDDSDIKDRSSPNPRKSSDEPLAAKRTAPAPKKMTAHELREARRWQPPQLWGSKSPLLELGGKLRDLLLSEPEAWSCLDAADQQAILAKLPASHRLGGAPDIEALKNDDDFRNDCTRYCEYIGAGRLTEPWLKKAWTAHYKAVRGDFKEDLQTAFDELYEVNTSGQAEKANKGGDDRTENGAGKQDEDKMELDDEPGSAKDDDKAKDSASKNGLGRLSGSPGHE